MSSFDVLGCDIIGFRFNSPTDHKVLTQYLSSSTRPTSHARYLNATFEPFEHRLSFSGCPAITLLSALLAAVTMFCS
jgi:hypothetical protein